jgi:hypothetical protein
MAGIHLFSIDWSVLSIVPVALIIVYLGRLPG